VRGGRRWQWRGIMQINLYVLRDCGVDLLFSRGLNEKQRDGRTNERRITVLFVEEITCLTIEYIYTII
jgi:hypothetical protein